MRKKINILKSLKEFVYHLFGKKTPEEKMSSEKYVVRQAVKEDKKKLKEEDKIKQARIVFDKIEKMPEFLMANTILMYWSMSDELPTHDFIRKWGVKKTILLPVIRGHHMTIRKFSNESEMKTGEYNINEPSSSHDYLKSVELAIIPGIAFDKRKRRLGRGKGYYDRYLKNKNIIKWGVCFDFQLYEFIPSAAFDIMMDRIITPEATVL